MVNAQINPRVIILFKIILYVVYGLEINVRSVLPDPISKKMVYVLQLTHTVKDFLRKKEFVKNVIKDIV